MSELPDRVDSLYEAAIVPERWPAVLEALSSVSHSASGSLLVFDGVAAPRWRTTERTRDVRLKRCRQPKRNLSGPGSSRAS